VDEHVSVDNGGRVTGAEDQYPEKTVLPLTRQSSTKKNPRVQRTSPSLLQVDDDKGKLFPQEKGTGSCLVDGYVLIKGILPPKRHEKRRDVTNRGREKA